VCAWKNGRTMQPRSQQGTSLLVAMQVLATDEGIFLARVAFKDPSSGRVKVAQSGKVMWEGGIEDVEHFASVVGAACIDAISWTVS
jgi:hypothetical protein